MDSENKEARSYAPAKEVPSVAPYDVPDEDKELTKSKVQLDSLMVLWN